jgi:hypothetical protein
VELIVLNVGLDAEVINSKIFTIMVLMAIITTFITTPSVMWVYPSTYYRKRVLAADGSRTLDGGASDDALALTELGPDEEQAAALDKILDRFNPLVCVSSAISFVPTLMHLMQLIAGNGRKLRKTPIHVARMVEASERSSSIIKATHQTETFETDALLQMFRTFGRLTHVEVRSHLTIATKEDIAMDICEIVDSNNLDCLIIPWQTLQQQEQQQKLSPNTFLAANGSGGGGPDAAYWNTGTGDQNYIVRALLRIASRPVAVVCDRGVNLTDHDSNKQSVSILVPFFGGPDCREALRLALRLGRSAGTSVHILHIMFPADTENESSSPSSPAISSPAMFDNRLALPMIVSGARSSTPERLAPISDADRSLLDQVKAQISQRTLIDELSYETIVAVLGEPLERIVDRAKQQPFSLIIFGFLGAKWSIYSRQTGVDINSNQLGTAMMESLGHEYNNTSTMRSPNVNRRNSFTVHSRPPTNTEPSQLTLRSLFGAGSGIGGNNQHQQDRSGQQQNDNAIYSSRTAALGELGRRLLLDEQSIKSSLISVRSVRLSS